MKRRKKDIAQTMTLTMMGLDRARKELSRLVREAQKTNTRFLLSERGKPQAVVLGIDDYLKNILKRDRLSVVAEIQIEAREKGLDKVTMKEIDREIKAHRKEKSQSASK
ncbi:MAG: type II toxin-antitoxin system prevent-host-death family antitoxin [Ignavibacteriales bacterium]